MEKIQRIICGDNLIILKEIADESIDLGYIDPPFFTQKHYEVIWGDGAEIRQFNDRWITSEKDSEKNPKRSSKDINVYLEFMEPRIKEIYRVLKPTGSFYLHCDHHADAYLRVLCDKIFERNPNSVIYWVRTSNTGSSKARMNGYPNNTDTILLYNKSDSYTWNKQYREYDDKALLRFKYDDNDGNGKYCWNTLASYSEETLNKLLELKQAEKRESGSYKYKQYLKDTEGIVIPNFWNDIGNIRNRDTESFGYPTQKPEALLERIIQASSNEGDIVLDCFCGCGTTLAVAKRLKRQYIGIDVSPTACRLIAKRLGFHIQEIEGLPITSEEIAHLDGNEFQNFIIREFGGFSGKRGADGGIDGNLGELLIQVKKFKAGRMHLDTFSGMLLREKKTEGVFIALEFSKDFRAEVSRLKSENGIIIYWFDVQDIIDKKHYDVVNQYIPKQGLEKYNTVKKI